MPISLPSRSEGRPVLTPAMCRCGFSLLELLVAVAVIALIAVMLSTITSGTFSIWRRLQTDVTAFENARAAFDTMTRRLSQATLNTYLDYYDKDWKRRRPGDAAFVPAKYGRASDLHFVSGAAQDILGKNTLQGHGVFFFAPLGFTDGNATYADLPNLLNPMAYYVEWGGDNDLRPGFLAPLPVRHRFRLIEAVLPSQDFVHYPNFTDTDANNDDAWITDTSTGLASTKTRRHPLADNIIALIIRPEVTEKDADLLGFTGNPKGAGLTRDYYYDSRAGEQRTTSPEDIQFAQLPPLLRVVMVAVSEKDAARLTNGSSVPDAFKLNSTWFTNPTKLDVDLKALSDQLTAAKVQFRVFNQVIALRSAKFSAEKEK